MPTYKLTTGSTQWQFHQSRAKVQIFGGAFANGKSTALIIKALKLSTAYPGSLGLMGRATYPKLKDTLQFDFMRWCPKGWIKKRPTQDDNSVYFANGSVIHFRYISQRGKTREDGSTTSNLLSASYDWAIVDQIEDPEIVYKDFLDILGRLRRQTPYRPEQGEEDETMPSTGPRWFMIGANPSRNWFYREIVYPYQLWRDRGIFSDKLIVDTDTHQPMVDMFESSTYENKDNLEPDYIKGLEASYKGQMRERYLLGKWAAFEGLVYPQFDPAVHLISRKQMMDYLDQCLSRNVKLRVVEAYDFGNVSPTCYIIAFVDDFGRVFVLDGFYTPEFPYTQHAPAVYEVRNRYVGLLHSRDAIQADPDIFRKKVIQGHDTGTSIARLLRDDGLKLQPAQNEVGTGIAKVSAYLSGKKGVPHIVTGDDPGPLIYFADDLPFVTDEFSSYYWKKNPQGLNLDEPVDGNDHFLDDLKYLLSRLPEPSKIIIPRDQVPPGYMFWREMSVEEYNNKIKAR